MADILKMITAKRYIENEERICYYLGTYQTDGWIYFNDDIFWRHNPEFNITQLLYLSKEVWCNTNNLEITNIGNLNGTQAQNVINGAGSVAPNANVEKAVQWAIDKVTNENIGYSWTNRNVKNPNGSTYDCSSFVITAMYVGGFDVDTSYGSTTTTMLQQFTDLGFTWIPGSYWSADDLIRGDIQLNTNSGALGHTNIYIGNNQDVDAGDAPARVIAHTPDDFGKGWHGILRYI